MGRRNVVNGEERGGGKDGNRVGKDWEKGLDWWEKDGKRMGKGRGKGG